MSTFSTKGGLYERAQKKYKLSDGKTLFTYTFFDRRRLEAQAFFADIYLEATTAQPAPGHLALAALLAAGRLQRHYTMNIDGLAAAVGMDTWHPESNPAGITVEMHGNVRLLVCTECAATLELNPALVRQLKAQKPVPCHVCQHEALRFKVMMYEDAESESITPEEVMDLMEEDVKRADLILWVGISFQQSASTVYFRNVRKWLAEAGRLDDVLQAVVNPSDEALWNLMTASSNQSSLNVLEVLAESDEILPLLAKRLAPASCPRAQSLAVMEAALQQEQQQQAQGEQQLAGETSKPAVAAAVVLTQQGHCSPCLPGAAAQASGQQSIPLFQQQQSGREARRRDTAASCPADEMEAVPLGAGTNGQPVAAAQPGRCPSVAVAATVESDPLGLERATAAMSAPSSGRPAAVGLAPSPAWQLGGAAAVGAAAAAAAAFPPPLHQLAAAGNAWATALGSLAWCPGFSAGDAAYAASPAAVTAAGAAPPRPPPVPLELVQALAAAAAFLQQPGLGFGAAAQQ
ncbi:hypothetical protein N2152v2_007093 [Parachlorella kessleri]